jgi:hypothetical protein
MFANSMIQTGGNIPQDVIQKIEKIALEFYKVLNAATKNGKFDHRIIRLLKPTSFCVLLTDKNVHFVLTDSFSGVPRGLYEDFRGKGILDLSTAIAIVQRDLQYVNPFGFTIPTSLLESEPITSDKVFPFVEQYYSSEVQFFERLAKEVRINPIFKGRGFFVEDKKCFVLMPFNNECHLQEIYQDTVKPVIEKLGIMCQRADDIYETKPIIESIWEQINKSKFIVADLTNKNANVFYELGIAHTIGKDVILLSQNIDDVPFDLRHLKIILYETTPRGVENLQKQLSSMVQSIIS